MRCLPRNRTLGVLGQASGTPTHSRLDDAAEFAAVTLATSASELPHNAGGGMKSRPAQEMLGRASEWPCSNPILAVQVLRIRKCMKSTSGTLSALLTEPAPSINLNACAAAPAWPFCARAGRTLLSARTESSEACGGSIASVMRRDTLPEMVVRNRPPAPTFHFLKQPVRKLQPKQLAVSRWHLEITLSGQMTAQAERG